LSAGIVILGMALINLMLRCPLFLVANRIRIPGIVEKALAHCPVAVLTAIIVPFALHLDQAPGARTAAPGNFLIARRASRVERIHSRSILENSGQFPKRLGHLARFY
jgi:branched-subunit amino acid transport protein